MIEFFKKYTNYLVWLITFVITLIAGIHLCRKGISVSAPDNNPAGNPYTWEPYMLIIILAMVIVSGIGLYLRKMVSRQPAMNWYWRWLDSFLTNPMTTVPWAIFLCIWLVLFDVYALLPASDVPPLSRIIQMTVKEMEEGHLISAVTTTVLRNGAVLMLASLVSIILIMFMGEYRKVFRVIA